MFSIQSEKKRQEKKRGFREKKLHVLMLIKKRVIFLRSISYVCLVNCEINKLTIDLLRKLHWCWNRNNKFCVLSKRTKYYVLLTLERIIFKFFTFFF